MLLWTVGDPWADFEAWLLRADHGLLFVPESGHAYLVDVNEAVVDVYDDVERVAAAELVEVLTATACGLILVTASAGHWSSHFLPPIVAVVQPAERPADLPWPQLRSLWLPAPLHPPNRCGALYCPA